MFQLNDQFLTAVGLDGMSDDDKKSFLQHTTAELEMRIGEKISNKLNETQMKEFESIIDKDESVIQEWIKNNSPDYTNDDLFKKIKEATKKEDAEIITDYVSAKWLSVNCPEYPAIVSETIEDIKKEIITKRDSIKSENAA